MKLEFDESTLKQPRSPAISVVIPAYNTADCITSALRSVFCQTFTDFEVIVINDGSPDSEDLESALAPYLGRILYLKQSNRGVSAARNAGIGHAKGEFIAFLDSDDIWEPEYLSQQLRVLVADSLIDMVFCDALWSGRTLKVRHPSTGPVTFDSLITERTHVVTSGAIVRRESVVSAGLFDESLRRAEDYDLWLRLAHAGCKMIHQPKVLVRHFVRPNSLGSPPGSLAEAAISVLKKISRDLDLSPETRVLLSEKLFQFEFWMAWARGRDRLVNGDVEGACDYFVRATSTVSTPKVQLLLLGLRRAPKLTLTAVQLWWRMTGQVV